MGIKSWAVLLQGVSAFDQLKARIVQRYPHARVQRLDIPGQVGVILPQPTWHMTPDGDEGFFSDLYLQGLITSYQAARVEE